MSEETHEESHEESHNPRRAARAQEAETPEAAEAPIEALLGLRDFLAVAPQRRSRASSAAAHAALRRWMTLHTQDSNGFYTLPQWQAFYAQTLAYTGR